MPVNSEIGKTIVYIRKSKGLTQEELAFRCGMSASHLGKIEHGKVNTMINTLARIAKGLEMELANLIAISARAELEKSEEEENIS
ncbi:hypothetical protein IMSAG049_00381 [Clostridiales bacterium]|nr:hypothetical protein IMSAG049_00381 [Clostridiales bacterium]